MKISELNDAPTWLKQAIVKNEDVKIIDGVVNWLSGEWISGEFIGGKFLGGEFRGGYFLGGEFWGGEFRSGYFLGGEFRGGYFRSGEFRSGEFWGGEFWGGEFRGGEFLGGEFLGGNFLGGNFRGEKIISSGSLSPAKSTGRTIFWIISKSHQYVRAGCFSGTIAELRNKAQLEHVGQNLAWYESACNAIEMMIKAGE